MDVPKYHFYHFGPPFVLACSHGSIDVVKMMIDSSKEFGSDHSDHIDLNAKDKDGETALDVVKSKIRFGDPGKRDVYNELKTLLSKKNIPRIPRMTNPGYDLNLKAQQLSAIN